MGATSDEGLGAGSLSSGFAASSLESFALGVVGDLHLEPDQMHLFQEAAQQLRKAVGAGTGFPGARIVQLGDLGGYRHKPGSWQCFRVASEYLATFEVPSALVTGNHDLEGDEFATDEANLEAWQQAFGQRHYWEARLGPAVCLGLSTVRFRSNRDSVHEVFVDAAQLAWFEARLEAAAGRPVLVFTHAPPLGSGLKVVEGVHVKNRCAWLNHSSRPEVFLSLVQRFPNVKVWFSGHYHLSQSFPDSISAVGGCAFVQTGVIGQCNRDGDRQSRILRGDERGYTLHTLDHDTGRERLDLQCAWDDEAAPVTEWLERPREAWWPQGLAHHQRTVIPHSNPAEASTSAGGVPEAWFGAGPDVVLRRMDSLLVEYRASYRAAVGAVWTDIDPRWSVRLVDGTGREVASGAHDAAEDGGAAVAVELVDARQKVRRRVERNAEGGFFQIFQRNKWRAKQREQDRDLAAAR